MLPTAEEERITVRFVSVNNISKKKQHCTSRLNEDEVGNPQHKGLWGLSVGFPSAGYSLHFISWLTRCVAIHLELLRSFDPPSLQALPLPDKNSALQLKSFCVQQEDGAGGQAGDLWLSPTTPTSSSTPQDCPPPAGPDLGCTTSPEAHASVLSARQPTSLCLSEESPLQCLINIVEYQ